jgi:hypothetical protein
MSRLENRRFQGLIVTAVCVLAALVACSTDSPTAPLQVPPPPSDGGGVGTGQAPFITSISPNNGPEAGNTNVKIVGTGFFAPLRVFFDGVPATVSSVASTEIQVRTPRFSGDFEDTPDGCSVSGETRYVPKAVTVTVENASGESGSLANGFSYNPEDSKCGVKDTGNNG